MAWLRAHLDDLGALNLPEIGTEVLQGALLDVGVQISKISAGRGRRCPTFNSPPAAAAHADTAAPCRAAQGPAYSVATSLSSLPEPLLLASACASTASC